MGAGIDDGCTGSQFDTARIVATNANIVSMVNTPTINLSIFLFIEIPLIYDRNDWR